MIPFPLDFSATRGSILPCVTYHRHSISVVEGVFHVEEEESHHPKKLALGPRECCSKQAGMGLGSDENEALLEQEMGGN